MFLLYQFIKMEYFQLRESGRMIEVDRSLVQ